jgi:hypothetical protein
MSEPVSLYILNIDGAKHKIDLKYAIRLVIDLFSQYSRTVSNMCIVLMAWTDVFHSGDVSQSGREMFQVIRNEF